MGANLELTKEIAVPVENVFLALTEPSELDRWWTTSSQSDARPGGAFEFRWEFSRRAGREDHSQSGEYLELEPDRLIAYPWQVQLGGTEVAIMLSPSDGKTMLRLVHSGWGAGEAWEASARMHEEGWGFFLDNLKAYLEEGEDRRAMMGLKTPAVSRG